MRFSLAAAALWMAGPARPPIEPNSPAAAASKVGRLGYNVMRVDAYGHLLALLAADQHGALHEIWVNADTDNGAKKPGMAVGFLVGALFIEVLLVVALVVALGFPLP